MGVWAGDKLGTVRQPSVNARNTPINATFVSAFLKGALAGQFERGDWLNSRDQEALLVWMHDVQEL